MSHSMDAILLVTGATGNVGVELCRALVRDYPRVRARLLVRAVNEDELRARWLQTVRAAQLGDARDDLPGCEPIRGDVSAPGLGLEAPALERLASDTTHIVHAACLTSFATPAERLVRTNVGGLENVLRFARRCRALRAVAHVSTCFTAGRRVGTIREDELEHDAGFVNAYERSKYDAERMARAAMADLPLSVYRLSLLVGRRDGFVHRPQAMHVFLENLYQGLFPLVPGDPEAPFDILPTDYAAEALLALVLRRFAPSQTYHIAAGEHAPTTLAWLATTAEVFRALSPAWRAGAHIQPDLVDLDTYRHLVDTVATVGNKTLARMLRVISDLAEYPLSSKHFDRSNVVAALGTDSTPPAFADYYPVVLEAAARGGWWRTSA
jgi:long-chain acyl-CoA synthetase